MIKLHAKQYEVYRDKTRFRVVVAGRRFGKCLASGTMISMSDGSEKPIERVVPGDSVLTINEGTMLLEPKTVKHVMDNGNKETLLVKTSRRELRCTPNHPILANGEWVDAGNLKVGDLVAVPKRLAFGTKRLPSHVVDYLAIWLAEGSFYTISNTTSEILDVLRKAITGFDNGLTLRPSKSKPDVDWKVANGDRSSRKVSKNAARLMLEGMGLWGRDSKTKFIPDILFELEGDQLARFLNLFFACDGCITKKSKNTWSVELGLANEGMTRQIAKLLHKFGIVGSIYHKVHKSVSAISGKPFESWTYCATNPTSVCAFAERIGCLSKERQLGEAYSAMRRKRININEYLPVRYDEFVRHLTYSPVQKGKYGGYNAVVARDLPCELREGLNVWRKQTVERVSRYRFEKLRGYSDGSLNVYADGDVAWEEVVAIEDGGVCQTWDLTIEDNHNFVSNGIVTHNSFLSKAELIRAARLPKQKVWYVAPSYRMAKQIMWHDLLATIPRGWVTKVNETSMSIWLVNGSVIELKGVDSPDSLRGVGLNFIVLDEVQDMKPDVWTKVLRPTLATTQGSAIFIGTPKGKAGLAYELWLLGQDSKNRHSGRWRSWQFITADSPFVPKDEIEAARQDMDEKSFRQEFEACHLPDTEIRLWSGRSVKIKDILPGSQVAFIDENGVRRPCEVLNVGTTGEKEIEDVVLETGEIVSASANHKFKVHKRDSRED